MGTTTGGATAHEVHYADSASQFKDGGNDTGSLFVTMRVRLRRLFFGNDAVAKSFRYGYVSMTLPITDEIDVQWQSNIATYVMHTIGTGAGSRWGAGAWGAGAWGVVVASQNERIEMDGYGYYLDVTFTHDEAGGLPIISRWQVDGFALGRR
jgi:hypothetical protein